ncbi:hypothetical protein IFM89_039889 [Coptis chinensis]|uniref:Cytochrome b5 heme-binding domain-containing protein n=1 Tax=Coptis chinensis TaxID=261450 RepID=A0A835GVH6_9MAGN|nr:hypothetical protein IFM89_039889 [Coptis chinensis]
MFSHLKFSVSVPRISLENGGFLETSFCCPISFKYLHKPNYLACTSKLLFQVYDATPFMDDHPGGDEVLLSATGKDATNDFEDVGHSDVAREMMDKYYIGEIDPSTVPLRPTNVPLLQPHEEVPVAVERQSKFKNVETRLDFQDMVLSLHFLVVRARDAAFKVW